MKDETVLKLAVIGAVVAVYYIFVMEFGINGQLFWGILAFLGALAGVKFVVPKLKKES